MVTTKINRFKSLYKQLKKIEGEIVEEVIKLKKTQEYNNVTFKYNSARKTFNYKKAAEEVKKTEKVKEVFENNKKISYDYKKICSAIDVEDIEFKVGNPSVTIAVK